MSGLWCVNAGHGREEIANAIRDQVLEIDYAPNYHIAHPKSFDMSNRLLEIMPEGLVPEGMSNVFFANSGSEAVESALKIAMAYHFARGEDQRTRLIGRICPRRNISKNIFKYDSEKRTEGVELPGGR
jgi:beta-alanine--pyruvate transaminase